MRPFPNKKSSLNHLCCFVLGVLYDVYGARRANINNAVLLIGLKPKPGALFCRVLDRAYTDDVKDQQTIQNVASAAAVARQEGYAISLLKRTVSQLGNAAILPHTPGE